MGGTSYNILAFIRDPRADPTAVPRNFAHAFVQCGHKVRYLDPHEVIPPQQEEAYFIDKQPFPLSCLNSILQYYDLVIYNNWPLNIDARNCPCATLQVYDEDWKGVQIFPGTDYLFSDRDCNHMLELMSPYTFKQLKGWLMGGACGHDPASWVDHPDKTIPLAYPGALRSYGERNYLFQPYYKFKRQCCLHAEKEVGLKYWDPPQQITEYVQTLGHVAVAVHFSGIGSNLHRNGHVGQGCWEDMAAGCCVMECPETDQAKAEGLIDGVNCVFFNTPEELVAKYKTLTPEKIAMIAKNGKELTKLHKWCDVFLPVVPFIEYIVRKQPLEVDLTDIRGPQKCRTEPIQHAPGQ